MTYDAKFIEWREVEGGEPLAVFEIVNPRHRFHGMTVSFEFCGVNRVKVEPFPTFEEWKQKQGENQ
jgi:hypothetical protein